MKKNSLLSVFTLLLSVSLAVWFLFAVARVYDSNTANGKQQLEDALRRAVITCYATEGIYPPSLSYLQNHYGVQIDQTHYKVFYEVYGENLMPEITVLEKE